MRLWITGIATIALLASCEPDYHATTLHDSEPHDVTGGADPQAVSAYRPDTSVTIHHPGAGGNVGRPPDDTFRPDSGPTVPAHDGH